MNIFINIIKYSVFALVLMLGFSTFTNQAHAEWKDSTGDVEYDVISLVVNAGPDRSYSLASGATTKPSVKLPPHMPPNVLSAYVDNPANVQVYLKWTKVSQPSWAPAATITDDTTLTPTFGNLTEDLSDWENNRYEFKLTLVDASGVPIKDLDTQEEISDKMTVFMHRETPRALAEVTNAAEKETITFPGEDNKVFVDGIRSKDYDQVGGGIVAYEWTQLSGPVGANIKNADSAKTEITNLKVGTYVFQLKVTDADNLYDRTDPADDSRDPDSPYFDNIIIKVEGTPPEPNVYLEIDPECEIPAYGTECPSFPGGAGEGAYWGSENMDVTSMEFFDKADLSNPLDTSFSRSSDNKLDLNNLVYPSRTFRLVAQDDDPATADVILEDTVVAKCVANRTWGARPDSCIPNPKLDGFCNNAIKFDFSGR